MNFVQRKGRDEMYIKYVHQLVNVSYTRLVHEACTDNSTLDAFAISKLY